MPPLREREADLIPIIEEISADVSSRLSLSAMRVLHEYAWPGNIRELKNMISCLEVEVPRGSIEQTDLPISTTGPWRSLSSTTRSLCNIKVLPNPLFQEESQASLQSRSHNRYCHSDWRPDDPCGESFILEPKGDKYLVTGGPGNNHDSPPHDPHSPPPAVMSGVIEDNIDESDQLYDLHADIQKMTISELLSHLPPLTLEEIKAAYTWCRYEQCGQNVSETSRELGLSRGTTYRLLYDSKCLKAA